MAQQTRTRRRAVWEALRQTTALALSLALVITSTPPPARAATEDDLPEVTTAQEPPQEEAAPEASDETLPDQQAPATDDEAPSQQSAVPADDNLLLSAQEEGDEDPILSLAFEPATNKPIIEQTAGSWQTDEDGTDYWHYNSYHFQAGDQLTITYASGAYTYTLNEIEEGEFGEIYGGSFVDDDGEASRYLDELSVTDNQAETHWGVGTHHYVLSLTGCDVTCEIPVEIIANPVDAISYEPAKPIIYLEGSGGWANDADIDNVFYEYDYPTCELGDVLTVTYADERGEVRYVFSEDEEDSYAFVNEQDSSDTIAWSDVDISCDQADNPWLVESDNHCVVTYSGRSCDVPVTIEQNSVASIAFEPAQPIVLTMGAEGDGESDSDELDGWRFRYSYAEGDVLMVERTDGTTRSYSYDPASSSFMWADGDESDQIAVGDALTQWVDRPEEGDAVVVLTYACRTAEVPCVLNVYTVTDVQYVPSDTTILASDVMEGGRHNCGPREGDELVLTEELSGTGELRTRTYRFVIETHDEDGYVEQYFVDEDNPTNLITSYDVYGEGSAVDESGRVVSSNTFWNLGEGNSWYFVYRGQNNNWENGEKLIEVPVTLVADGAASISYEPVEPLTYTPHSQGYWHGHWDDSTDEYIDDLFVYTFSPSVGDRLVVTDEQGNQTTYTYDNQEAAIGSYYADPDDPQADRIDESELAFSQGYDEGGREWSAGVHRFEVHYRGCGTEVPVTISGGSEPDPVTQHDLSDCGRIELDTYSYPYTGDRVDPEPHVYAVVDGKEIEIAKGTDYVLTYDNNTNAGEATVTATGIGSFEGSVSDTFEITPIDLDSADVEVDIPDQTYTGEPIEPDFEVKVNGRVLAKDVDYTVAFDYNEEPGEARARIIPESDNYINFYDTYFEIKDPYEGLTHDTSGGCTWYIEDGVLTVKPTKGTSGTLGYSPWEGYEDEIESVRFEPGVKAPESVNQLLAWCENLREVDFTNLDTSATTDFSGLLEGCPSLTAVDLSGLDFSAAKDLSNLLLQCSNLTSVTWGAHDLSKVTTMEACLRLCEALKTVDLSGLSINPSANMTDMFSETEIESFTVGTAYPLASEGAIPVTTRNYFGSKWYSDAAQQTFEPEEIAARAGISDTYTLHVSDIGGATAELPGCKYHERDNNYTTTYTGKPITPDPQVTLFGKTLVRDVDFTVRYQNNLNRGNAFIYLEGIGDYEGSLTLKLIIGPKYVSDEGVSVRLTSDTATYAGPNGKHWIYGKIYQPDVVVTDGDVTLVNDTDYTIEYKPTLGAGTVMVYGSGNYSGMVSLPFTLEALDVSDLTAQFAIESGEWHVFLQDSYSPTYTGSPITPKAQVKVGKVELVEGVDYELSYESNTEIGTACMVVKGIGCCVGEKRMPFEIVGDTVSISGAKLALSSTAFTYNGKAQKPTVSVKLGDKTLAEGTDYTLAYSNASSTAAGSYIVTVTGVGSYEGTATASYKISKAANPLKVKAKKGTVTVKYSKVKKKAQTPASNVKFTAKGQGSVIYANASSGKVKKWKVNAKTGKITVPKKTKKGTYKIKIKVVAKGNGNYNASTKYVSYKIKVK